MYIHTHTYMNSTQGYHMTYPASSWTYPLRYNATHDSSRLRDTPLPLDNMFVGYDVMHMYMYIYVDIYTFIYVNIFLYIYVSTSLGNVFVGYDVLCTYMYICRCIIHMYIYRHICMHIYCFHWMICSFVMM